MPAKDFVAKVEESEVAVDLLVLDSLGRVGLRVNSLVVAQPHSNEVV